MKWIKWWKNKTFLKIWGIILTTIGISLGIILINPDSFWCIIGSISIALFGGFILRKIIKKKLDEYADTFN